MEEKNMKRFAWFAGVLMLASCFAGLAIGLDPLDDADADADPDRDGLKNADEFTFGLDPNDPDSDGAGAYDGWEIWYETHRALRDVETGEEYIAADYHFDGNCIADEGVVANPDNLIQVRDSDANALVNDPDGDGWNNLHEFLVGSDPTNPNTDGDSYTEDASDPDPLVSNDDHDGGGGMGCEEGDCGGQGDGQGNGGGGSGAGEGMAVIFA
jgi:hypothetical protein